MPNWKKVIVSGSDAHLNTLELTNTTTNDSILITSTDAGASAAPLITLKRNSGSPANSDYLGQVRFKGENNADQEVTYAKISGKILDITDSSEDGIIEFSNMKNGSQVVTMRLRSDSLQLLNSTSLSVAGNISTTATGSFGRVEGTLDFADLVIENDEIPISKLAIDAIRNGEVVGIPTETVYGIGVDPYSQTAVDKIFSLKERSEKKPLSILISSFHEIQKLNVTTSIPDVVELYWPGPLTIIVETSNDFANGVGTKEPSSIGVTVPENELAINLLKQTGPLAVTSANISGEEDFTSDEQARAAFGDEISHYLSGESLHGNGSTVVDLRVDGGEVLRQGPLKWPPSYC